MKSKTSPKQKLSAAERESDRWLAWEDALLDHCHALTTLAELLAHAGRNDTVPLAVVNHTGSLMKGEVARLKQRLLARPGRRATP